MCRNSLPPTYGRTVVVGRESPPRREWQAIESPAPLSFAESLGQVVLDSDRTFWRVLSRLWSRRADVLVVINTVVRWHRAGQPQPELRGLQSPFGDTRRHIRFLRCSVKGPKFLER